MSMTKLMIKQAAANLADYKPLANTKVAFTPAPGGQIPPPVPEGGMPPGGAPPMDPAAAGMPPGGAPPMDPAAAGMPPGGAPPMDPAMMGGAPPVDPAAAGGAPLPPMDPSMLGAPPADGAEGANSGDNDYDNDGKPDVMVPLGPITDFATKLIEATKGKRTADAPPPKGPGDAAGAPMDPAAVSPAASIGGAPASEPTGAMPKLSALRAEIVADRGY